MTMTTAQQQALAKLEVVGSVTLTITVGMRRVRSAQKRFVKREWSVSGFNSNVLSNLEKAGLVDAFGDMPGPWATKGVWVKTWTSKEK